MDLIYLEKSVGPIFGKHKCKRLNRIAKLTDA